MTTPARLPSSSQHPKRATNEAVHSTAASTTSFWRDPRPTNENPNFVRHYFQSSRLHFIGSFRARYESMMVAVGNRLNVHPSILLRPSPRPKSNVERVIVHVDMDCFFASIACVKNPDLRAKCIAVCHGGGEISSCSYEARAYGVRAGMFCRNARKLCPQLLSVDYDFPTYEQVSTNIYSFFYDYPGVSVEAVSVDEAYLDITETVGKNTSQSGAETLVASLRHRIEMETGCTASAGIGPSKLMARLATKGAKPNGQLRVRQEDVIKYLDTLSVKDLPGIGWRTSKRLASQNITTVPQLRALSIAQLQHQFGERQGQVFHDLVRALDSRSVEPLKPRKSIGAEASWGVRFTNRETEKARKFIQDIADVVASRVIAAGAYGRKMIFKLYRRIPDSSMEGYKHLGHGPCTILTKSAKLPRQCVGTALTAALKEICLNIYEGWKIRHDEFRGLGVQVTDLTFVDLNLDHLNISLNGNRRIDTFFSAATSGKGGADPKSTRPIQAENKKDEQGVKPIEAPATVGEDECHVAMTGEASEKKEIARTQRHSGTLQDEKPITNVGGVGEDDIAPQTKEDVEGPRKQNEQEEGPKKQELSNIPEGWNRQVFEELPKEIQAELLGGQARAFASVGSERPPLPRNDAGQDKPTTPERSRKRRRESRKHVQRPVTNGDKRTRRKQSAQITMTQCADISELRRTGHEVLNAEEFRERPLKEVVELLGDLNPRGRVAKTLTFKKPGAAEETRRQRETMAVGMKKRIGAESSQFDIPSPPSLSSDSDSSYDVGGAIEKHGLDHSRVYAEEEIWQYAPKLHAWMRGIAKDIKSGHVELVRSRVLEMVQLKELERACTELRTIRSFATGKDMGAWKGLFNDVLADTQQECLRMYGFRLRVGAVRISEESNDSPEF